MMQYTSSHWYSVAYALPEQALHNKVAGSHYQKRAPVSVLETQRVKSSQQYDKGSDSLTVQTRPTSNMKSITSTSNPLVKHCVKLRQNSSYRDSHGLALVVGTTLIREIHEFQMSKQEQQKVIEYLFLLDKTEGIEEICDIPGDRVYVSSAVMKKLSGVQSTESIEAAALMRIPPSVLNLNDGQSEMMHWKSWFPCLHRILVLEGIQDPGNLGTLLRSALAFKWNGVFLLPGCCDPFNEKALRASRGAPFQIPVVSGNWAHLEALSTEAHVKILAGHPDTRSRKVGPVSKLSHELAASLADMPVCLVLGTEGGGLSGKAKELAQLVSIPMSENFESLNVAVAGGIFMFVLMSERT